MSLGGCPHLDSTQIRVVRGRPAAPARQLIRGEFAPRRGAFLSERAMNGVEERAARRELSEAWSGQSCE
jgi:hypothetical protein